MGPLSSQVLAEVTPTGGVHAPRVTCITCHCETNYMTCACSLEAAGANEKAQVTTGGDCHRAATETTKLESSTFQHKRSDGSHVQV